MRFSGHETFPCRHAWLPKAVRALEHDADALADDEDAMVTLGLGKNMVHALRFWVDVTRVATPGPGRRHELTAFARAVLGSGGFDPFLEDVRTLWLLHWHVASQREAPLFAWDFLLNRWQHPEVCRSELLAAFTREASRRTRTLSPVTLAQHLDIFLHSYAPMRGRTGAVDEDVLDCPFADLELLRPLGERRTREGRREPVYTFRREAKPEITAAVLAYCLDDFWNLRRPQEKTLSFRDVAVAAGSVGQVFKLPEGDLRARLEEIEVATDGAFTYRPSAAQPVVTRDPSRSSGLLMRVYAGGRNDG